MKGIILCEGKTDAILLSYFLIKCFGWEFIRYSEEKKFALPSLPVERSSSSSDNQSFNWYNKLSQSDQLAIWGVGGIEKIPVCLKEVVKGMESQTKEDLRFDKIVIFIDHDTRTDDECLEMAKKWIAASGITANAFVSQEWVDSRILLTRTTEKEHLLQVLFVVLPINGEGNLEAFLLGCLKAHSKNDADLVNEAKIFINKVEQCSYLSKDKCKQKAHLGVVLSVMSPERVFSEKDEILRSVEWEKIIDAFAAYKKLELL